jgi:hypothetical protein
MGAYYIFLIEEYVNPVVALNSALRFTPLEIMPRSVLSPAIAGLKFLTG